MFKNKSLLLSIVLSFLICPLEYALSQEPVQELGVDVNDQEILRLYEDYIGSIGSSPLFAVPVTIQNTEPTEDEIEFVAVLGYGARPYLGKSGSLSLVFGRQVGCEHHEKNPWSFSLPSGDQCGGTGLVVQVEVGKANENDHQGPWLKLNIGKTTFSGYSLSSDSPALLWLPIIQWTYAASFVRTMLEDPETGEAFGAASYAGGEISAGIITLNSTFSILRRIHGSDQVDNWLIGVGFKIGME